MVLPSALAWTIGEDHIGKFIAPGGGHTIETTMRFYPRLGLGVMVMNNSNGSQVEKIAEGLVRAWKQKDRPAQ